MKDKKNIKGFFDVPRETVLTSEGPVDLPMFFYYGGGRGLNFFVDCERVTPLLAGTGLEPCRFCGNKAAITLAFFNYRDVSIGGYDEVFIATLVIPDFLPRPKHVLPALLRGGSSGSIGATVLEMPVTSPRARAAGREIWGFPKFEARIPFRITGNEFEFSVIETGGETLLAVKGSYRPLFRKKATGSSYGYLCHDGHIVRVSGKSDGDLSYGNCRELEIHVSKNDHRFAHTCRSLGLEKAYPFMVMATDNLRATLNAGERVAKRPSPPLPYAVESEWERAVYPEAERQDTAPRKESVLEDETAGG